MTTLFGIKNCDTVKKARRWLDDQGIKHRFHDFRIDGLEISKIQEWLSEISQDKLINKRSTTWKSLSDSEKQQLGSSVANNEKALELIIKNPTLIKRPVLETSGQVHVGFKPDDYQTLLG